MKQSMFKKFALIFLIFILTVLSSCDMFGGASEEENEDEVIQNQTEDVAILPDKLMVKIPKSLSSASSKALQSYFPKELAAWEEELKKGTYEAIKGNINNMRGDLASVARMMAIMNAYISRNELEPSDTLLKDKDIYIDSILAERIAYLEEETGLGSGEAETSLRLLPDFKYQVITSGPYDRIISMPDQEVGTNNASGDWTPIPGVLLDDTYSWNTTTKAVKYEYIEETNGNPSQKYSISYDPTTKTGVFLLDFDCTGNDIMSMTLREDPENSGNNGAFVYNQMRYTYTDDEGDEILSTYSIKGYAADNGGKLLLSCAWGAGIDREVREYDFTFDQMSYGSFSDPTLIAKAELSDDEILELRGYSEEASGIALEETRELTGAEVDKPILFFKDQLVFTGSSTTSGTYETLSTPNPLPKEVAVGDCSEADLVNILLLDVGFSGEAYAYKIIPNEADQKKTELVYLGHLNIDPQV